MAKHVRIWEEDCIIPTYSMAPPEKSPLFIEKELIREAQARYIPCLSLKKYWTIKRMYPIVLYIWKTNI